MTSLMPTTLDGTDRLVAPELTMLRLRPMLERCGVTRVADITSLDEDFGVSTFTAIRPTGLVLQTGNGKGLSRAAAWVSAVMEAIELFHAECPDRRRMLRGSERTMRAQHMETFVPLRDDIDRQFYHSATNMIDWIQAEDLGRRRTVWIPSSSTFFLEPTIYRTHTNGLASGNHEVEATLHAIYELVERDAISGVAEGGALHIEERCRVVDPRTLDDPALAAIHDRIAHAGSQLVLLWIPARIPVHVFWAFLLNRHAHHAATALVMGSGAHPVASIAALRAVTEAIQSRLTIIQSARDDLIRRTSFHADVLSPSGPFKVLASLAANTSWRDIPAKTALQPEARADLRVLLDRLVEQLIEQGQGPILRVSLEREDLNLPVVKVIVPSLRFHRELF